MAQPPTSLANADVDQQIWTAPHSRKFLETALHLRHCIPESVGLLERSLTRFGELPQEGAEYRTECWQDLLGRRRFSPGLARRRFNFSLARRRIRHNMFHQRTEDVSHLADFLYEIDRIDLIREQIARNSATRVRHACIGPHKGEPII